MLHRYVLQPLSPWGTPLRGDTLYGLILFRIGEEEGVEKLRQTLAAFRENRPPFIVSSAMPVNTLFAPVLAPAPREVFRKWTDDGAFCDKAGKRLELRAALSMYKKFRKTQYIPLAVWQKHAGALSVRRLFASFCKDKWDDEASGNQEEPFSKSGVEPHVTIARNTGSALEGGLFADTLTYFRAGAKLHLYTESAEPDRLLGYLERIGDLGFGKNSSTGKGRFAVQKDTEFNPATLPSTGSHRLILSPCAAGDMRALEGNYAIDVKRGKAAPHIAGGNPFKKPFLCVREGAVLSSLPKGPYVLDGVHDNPDIVQVVQPLSLPCELKEDVHAQ